MFCAIIFRNNLDSHHCYANGKRRLFDFVVGTIASCSQTVVDIEYDAYGDGASSERVGGCLSSSHAPSDGSIDLSVKSGTLGQEALGRYLKKKGNNATTSRTSSSQNEEADVETTVSVSQTIPAAATHLRIPSQLYPTPLHYPLNYKVPPHVNSPHPHPPRYSSPPPLPRPSDNPYGGEFSLGGLLSKPYMHAPSPSIDSIYSRAPPHTHSHNHPPIPAASFAYDNGRSSRTEYIHLPAYDGLATPAKREPTRIRIPSNPSVTSRNSIGRISSSSIEHLSEHGSPMPNFHVEVLSPGRPGTAGSVGSRSSLNEYSWNPSSGSTSKFKPAPDELRRYAFRYFTRFPENL